MNPLDLQSRDVSGVFGCLPLRVVEVCRNGDHGLLDLLAQIIFRRLLQVHQDHRRDFRRRVVLAADIYLDQFIRPAHDLVWHQLFFAGHLAVPRP